MKMDCAIRWNVEKSSSEIGSVRGASQECFGTQIALDLTSTNIHPHYSLRVFGLYFTGQTYFRGTLGDMLVSFRRGLEFATGIP